MDFMAKITNCVFKCPLSIKTKRTQVHSFHCKMDHSMDTGQYKMNAVEIPVAVGLLKFLGPFQKKHVSMLKLGCRNCSLMDNVTARNYLTEMDPDFTREDEMKDRRTKYPEVVDLLFRILGHATK